MSASTSLADVEKVLNNCAPGYRIRLANHSRVIHFAGKLYRNFPKHDPVENGHVRKLVRFFGIASCAAKLLPNVIKDDQPKAPPTKSQEKPKVKAEAKTAKKK